MAPPTSAELMRRPRRLRLTASIRDIVREVKVCPSDLIWPIFVSDGYEDRSITSLPGVKCYGLRCSDTTLMDDVSKAYQCGIRAIMLFPQIEEHLKDLEGIEAASPSGLIPRVILKLKRLLKQLLILTDVALDPYTSSGHDGIVDLGTGIVDNDKTVEQLCRQAVNHARFGADFVCPSDMMDGRIQAIRRALDQQGFQNVGIISYAVKYASCLYAPFRDAVGVVNHDPREKNASEGDENKVDDIPTGSSIITSLRERFKSTYQMDVSNGREALIETTLDEQEGADMLIIKPGTVCLDIVQRVRQMTNLPIASYHVSGEYAMIKAASQCGYIDEKSVVLETMKSIKRAGADLIITYYAKSIAEWLNDGLVETERCF